MANIGNHTFVDGVGDIRLRDGVVRMDLLALSPTRRDQEGSPVPQFVDQLVMSPRAFLRMVSALGSTVQQMQEKGLLGSADASASEESADAEGGSPNFESK
jgi:hypothetical protein